MGKQVFNIKGMMRDLDPAKSTNQYAYEIRNLRLTAQEDSTLLALVSEKGNVQYTIKNATGTSTYSLIGQIVGYCTLDTETLVLFTHDGTDGDNIYVLVEKPNNELWCKCLYGKSYANHTKDLGFTSSTNMETIGIYENENIKKVYWIDGVHQPRVINIAADTYTVGKWDTMTVCPFDFMMEMQLSELITISSEQNLFGMFPAGTIQYVLSYHSKNGQHSPAFHVSTLYYTTLNNKGVAPDKNASGAFKIQIVNVSVDSNFDYISIYSIQRTSLNGTPICKKVTDLKISDFSGQQYISYIDNGLSSETVDYSEILYLGGSNVVPYTMAHKNNTLFLGNIISNDFVITEEVMEDIRDEATISFSYNSKYPIEVANSSNVYYPYKGQLQMPASVVTTFKFGESYYFGIIAQNKYGQWSNVVPLNTERVQNIYPPYDTSNLTQVQNTSVVVTFTERAIELLNGLGCKKLKIVRLDEEPQIACQGVVCPTVYNKSRKTTNGMNYAQSSWYFRPIMGKRNYNEDNKVQYHHNMNLKLVTGKNCNEIQGSSVEDIIYDTCVPETLSEMDMFVDWNLLTMHSPDIEFGDESSFENIEHIRLVGIVPIEYGITSMFIDLATPPHSINGHTSTPMLIDSTYSTNNAPVCLSGFYYFDDPFTETGDPQWGLTPKWHMVFPWHRFTSLGSQLTPDTDDEWYGKLRSKCMATLRSSLKSAYIPGSIDENFPQYNIDITPFRCVDKLNYNIQIPADDNFLNPGGLRIYNGNVDTTLTGEVTNYGKTNLIDGTVDEISSETSSVRMNYKSSTHGVFSIKYGQGGTQLIMPNTARQQNAKADRNSQPSMNFRAKAIPSTIDGTHVVHIESANYIMVQQGFAEQYYPEGLDDYDYVILRNPSNLGDNTGDFGKARRVMTFDEASATPTASTYSPSSWYYLVDTNPSYLHDHCIGDPVYDQGQSAAPFGDYYYYIHLYISQSDTLLYSLYGRELLEIYYELEHRTYNGYSGYGTITFYGSYDYASSITFDEIQDITLPSISGTYDYMYLVDLVRNERAEITNFIGTNWLVAGLAHNVPSVQSPTLLGEIGDAYYQRYDCLKTFPFSPDAQNQIVDILSFMCETRVNLEGRYDDRRGNSDNTTVNDTNFNHINMAYSQIDNFFQPQYLDSDAVSVTYFPNQIWWTKTKIYGSKLDQWTHISPLSSLSLSGDLGKIKALRLWNDNLMCFQDKGISKIMYNERTTLSTQQGVPIEIANSGKVDGAQYISNQIGCSNKNSLQITQDGIYFIDKNTKEIYRWSRNLESLSKSKGFNTYMQASTTNLDTEKTFYDPQLKDVYFRFNKTNSTECLVFNEQLGEFTSFFDYDMDFLFPLQDSLVAVEHNSHNLWKQFGGSEYLRYFGRASSGTPSYENYSVEFISAENPTEDKIYTNVEFRADVLTSSITTTSQATETDVSLANLASINKLPFKTLRVWNEYQSTGDISFQRLLRRSTNLSQKFRIWRADIGRNVDDKTHPFGRIRSPWARIKLTGGGENVKTVIHDMAVMYI